MGFDPRCYELAAVFMDDNASRDSITELAQVIQDAIEDHMNVAEMGKSNE